MRNFIWSLSLLFAGISTSFGQTNGIEKGTYLSTNKGGKIKLNLLDNNKYELVFYSGDYKIEGDSLIFLKNTKTVNRFDLSFAKDKKAKKIKIKFLNPSYYSFFIGTQNGSEAVQYQRVADIKTKVDPDWKTTDLDFEIEKTDFLYLVYEDYNGKSDVSKYALPKDVSEVTINYDLAVLNDLNLGGFFDKKTNELRISESYGKDPLVFVNEKDEKPAKTPAVVPIQTESISNWTYPGKDSYYGESYGGAVVDSIYNSLPVDTTAVPAADYPLDPPSSYTKYDFKLKIEDNLKKAIESTKTASNKFLVVVVDDKNKKAKEDFDAFIKNQETQAGYSMYDSYNAQYDIYNYYLAGINDKKWLKSNKITNDPIVIVLNDNGDILATAKANLSNKEEAFNYYGNFYPKLLRTNALVSLGKNLKNQKASDDDLIQAFNKAALLAISYSYDSDYISSDPTELVFAKTVLDQKEVAQSWKKLIEAHQKDKTVNMYLVETILKEIKNEGFTKQLFNEDRILNDTDFLAIDYILKHSDEIEKELGTFNNLKRNDMYGQVPLMNNPISEVTNALQQNLYASQDGLTGEMNKEKINSVYKKIITSGKGNFDAYRNYFYYLSQLVDRDDSNTTYLREFNTYFDATLAGTSPIEKLDAIFSGLDSSSSYSYDGWNSFKEYHSDISNNAAWAVVTNPQNSNFIKDAIKWSEYSLVLTKNNPYYLDTLAQLYYKDGQKDKAIATQTLAVKYLSDTVEEETASEIKEVLAKMQNGTY
ncbi:hypothetical protein [Flavobacterium luteolum]|uniref:hypothetical protein n=1 Tax=Flavobacterium luteolum TaxID=3003259 RepID=UPI00248D5B52|nr:hypothetical protein [Flavobacterium luteolum]